MDTEFGTHLRNIAELLERCEHVRKNYTVEEKEAWTLAHDFLDLESSFRTFSQEHLCQIEERKPEA